MCSYIEKKSEPTDMMQLDGYTVDYSDKPIGIPTVIWSLVYIWSLTIAQLLELVNHKITDDR
jgi:hypothetical protein